MAGSGGSGGQWQAVGAVGAVADSGRQTVLGSGRQAAMASGDSGRQFEDCLLKGQHLKFQDSQLEIRLLS